MGFSPGMSCGVVIVPDHSRRERDPVKNADYWRGRFAILENSAHKQADEYLQTLEDIYRETEHTVQRDIESWYQRFATNNNVTLAEARKMLTTGQLEEFKWTAEQYVKAAQPTFPRNGLRSWKTLQPVSMSAALKQSNCKFNSRLNFCMAIRLMGWMIF